MPSANPDGDAADTRHNVNDEDLNRGFPGWRDMGRPRAELVRDREKEVKCLMNWILDNPFVLSVSFHDGQVGEPVTNEKVVMSQHWPIRRHICPRRIRRREKRFLAQKGYEAFI